MTDPAEMLLAKCDPKIRDLTVQLREVVRAAYPDLTETVRNGYGTFNYGTGPKMGDDVAYISFHKAHVNLGFMRGSQLPDPKGLLEGTGKLLRHVKIKKTADITEREADLKVLLKAALEEHANR
jgi:hypothetical protein